MTVPGSQNFSYEMCQIQQLSPWLCYTESSSMPKQISPQLGVVNCISLNEPVSHQMKATKMFNILENISLHCKDLSFL